MIDVYMWTTGNSRRATITLEEAGLDYVTHPTNIHDGGQKTPEHTARNPYQKVPVIINSDGPGGQPVTIFESGAIQLYIAEKTGKLYGADARDRVEVQKWFMLIMNAALPILSALRSHPDMRPDAERVMKVIDDHLADHQFFASDFSIADLAFYPRANGYKDEWLPLGQYAHLTRWVGEVGARPAVQAGWAQPKIA